MSVYLSHTHAQGQTEGLAKQLDNLQCNFITNTGEVERILGIELDKANAANTDESSQERMKTEGWISGSLQNMPKGLCGSGHALSPVKEPDSEDKAEVSCSFRGTASLLFSRPCML